MLFKKVWCWGFFMSSETWQINCYGISQSFFSKPCNLSSFNLQLYLFVFLCIYCLTWSVAWNFLLLQKYFKHNDACVNTINHFANLYRIYYVIEVSNHFSQTCNNLAVFFVTHTFVLLFSFQCKGKYSSIRDVNLLFICTHILAINKVIISFSSLVVHLQMIGTLLEKSERFASFQILMCTIFPMTGTWLFLISVIKNTGTMGKLARRRV